MCGSIGWETDTREEHVCMRDGAVSYCSCRPFEDVSDFHSHLTYDHIVAIYECTQCDHTTGFLMLMELHQMSDHYINIE